MPATENFSIDQYFYVPKSEADRIHRYTKYENIFLGNHRQAFNPKINFQDGDDNLYIVELVGQLISFTSADYLFGEAITISCEDKNDEFLPAFYEANKGFETQLYEAALSNSYFGDVVIELKVTDGKPIVMFHDPRLYSVVMDANNEPTQKILSFVVRKGELTYIYKRVHEKGSVKNELYQINTSVDMKKTGFINSKDTSELTTVPLDRLYPGLQPVEATGVADDFLIKSVPNMRTMNSVFGLSDYIGKESLMTALNALTSFAHLIIEKNADPGMEVPVGSFKPDANVYKEDLKVFQTDAETKGIPRYISPDLTGLQQLFAQRDHIIEMISLYSEISLSLLGKEGTSGGAIPDNYRAMKLRFYRTLQKMNRKKRYWEPALEWILTTSALLLKQTPAKYVFDWADGLPDDEQTELESMQLRKTIGIASTETLLQEWGKEYGWSDERIKTEIARLASQNVQNPTTEGASNLFSQTNKVDGTQPQN